MLTKEEALKLVSAELQRMSPPDDPFVIVEDCTIERPFGWVIFYNAKKYLETCIYGYRLFGTLAPIRDIDRLTAAHPGHIEAVRHLAKILAPGQPMRS
jgi:hypothetical protein